MTLASSTAILLTSLCVLATSRTIFPLNLTDSVPEGFTTQDGTVATPLGVNTPFSPGNRPDYELKPRDDLPASLVFLDGVFQLVYEWGSEVWRNPTDDETPPGKIYRCLADNSLCMYLETKIGIPPRTEMWLIIEAFEDNLKKNPSNTNQWFTQAYSYVRKNTKPDRIIATVEWSQPGRLQAGGNVTKIARPSPLDPLADLPVNLTSQNTDFNATELGRKGTTDVDVRLQWHATTKLTLSVLAWHLVQMLANTIWTQDSTKSVADSGWVWGTKWTSPKFGQSVINFEPTKGSLATWTLMEDAILKLWRQASRNIKGSFTSRWWLHNGGDSEYAATVSWTLALRGTEDTVSVA